MNQRNSLYSLITSGGLIQSAGALAVGSVVLLSLLVPNAAIAQRRGHDSDRPHRPSYSNGSTSDRHHQGDHRGDRHQRGNRDRGGHHYERHHDNHQYRSQNHHGSRYGYGGRYHFEVPRRLHRQRYSTYDPYYRGQRYYSAHDHHHRLYYFPVWADGHFSYAPHAYCGGALFQPSAPHLGVHFYLGF